MDSLNRDEYLFVLRITKRTETVMFRLYEPFCLDVLLFLVEMKRTSIFSPQCLSIVTDFFLFKLI